MLSGSNERRLPRTRHQTAPPRAVPAPPLLESRIAADKRSPPSNGATRRQKPEGGGGGRQLRGRARGPPRGSASSQSGTGDAGRGRNARARSVPPAPLPAAASAAPLRGVSPARVAAQPAGRRGSAPRGCRGRRPTPPARAGPTAWGPPAVPSPHGDTPHLPFERVVPAAALPSPFGPAGPQLLGARPLGVPGGGGGARLGRPQHGNS